MSKPSVPVNAEDHMQGDLDHPGRLWSMATTNAPSVE